jgi:ABC-2 type transport system permease protein
MSRVKSLRGSLVASEISVLFRRRRTWAMLFTISLIPIFLAIAVKLSGSAVPPGEGPPFLDRVSQNGLFVGFTAMILAIPLFLPLTMGVVAGDTIAGTAAFAIAATFTLMITGIAIGAILFPVGPVTLLSGDVVSIPAALMRIFLVAIYVTISLLGLASVGLLISTLTVIPVGAMAATVVFSTVMQILGTLPQIAIIHPFLLSYYWLGFADLLRNPMDVGSMLSNIVLQLAYIAIFGSLAYSRFTSKDVLS